MKVRLVAPLLEVLNRFSMENFEPNFLDLTTTIFISDFGCMSVNRQRIKEWSERCNYPDGAHKVHWNHCLLKRTTCPRHKFLCQQSREEERKSGKNSNLCCCHQESAASATRREKFTARTTKPRLRGSRRIASFDFWSVIVTIHHGMRQHCRCPKENTNVNKHRQCWPRNVIEGVDRRRNRQKNDWKEKIRHPVEALQQNENCCK